LRQVTPQELASLMFDLLGRMDMEEWQLMFDLPRVKATLGSNEVTLSALVQASFDEGKDHLRSVAQQRIDNTGAAVVVMGHTHQPDQKRLQGGMYYNPGCWTRYLEVRPGQSVTLDDLRNESAYPYQLNVVRVEPGDAGSIKSEMICFERG
jgi:predicted phosphodiesterase